MSSLLQLKPRSLANYHFITTHANTPRISVTSTFRHYLAAPAKRLERSPEWDDIIQVDAVALDSLQV